MEATTSTDVLYFEDLAVGDRWFSPERVITEQDVADFAALTGDHDPLHRDASSHGLPFGEPVAHGLLGLSVLAGLSTEHPRVSTLALTGLSEWSFEAPIYFGDRVRVATTVSEIQPHGRRAARVTWLRELINQSDRVVQRGHLVTLVASKRRRRGTTPAAIVDTTDTPSQRGTLPAR
ncbi:MaoC family dehydratase [Crateriforma conspicua]|uniref:MaoC family dehydratase n=1 Tax=Crateriforma conspicua TaxID=2527996 RepID=UPI001189B80C|nr:MaoC/PaaZ C-terminal domain-containing protein [Crateriforma conspicua]QDV65002.1 Bifunctional protein PaaZ [Crateriforma conspicua]